jgi:ATP-dependent DNA ligase
MSRAVKRSASPAVESGPSRRGRGLPLPRFIPPQLSLPVEKPPAGPQWLHEIKLDGFRMAARIDHGRAQLLTRTGLDWSDKYPSIVGRKDDSSSASYEASRWCPYLRFRLESLLVLISRAGAPARRIARHASG